MAHVLQALIERNSEATVLSIDDICFQLGLPQRHVGRSAQSAIRIKTLFRFDFSSHRPLTCRTIPLEMCTRSNREKVASSEMP